MRLIMSIACWGAALSVLVLMTVLLRFLDQLASPQGYRFVVKGMCRLMMRCFPLRIRVQGRERLDRRRSYLFIANHVNLLDAFVLEGHIPWIFSALEREKHFRWPVYGWFITTMRHIPLSLDGGPRTAVALRRADRVLRSGGSLVVMPEGNWTEDGTLAEFGRGAFRLAQRSNAEIVPIVQAGFFHAIPPRQWLVRSGDVRFVFGETIKPSDYPGYDDTMLAALARERMLRMLRDAGDRGPRRLRPPERSQRGSPASAALPGGRRPLAQSMR